MDVRQAIRPLWIFGCLMMMLDGLTTYLALTHLSGLVGEQNTLMASGIDKVGLGVAMGLKGLIGILLLAILAWRTTNTVSSRWSWVTWPFGVERVKHVAAYCLAFSSFVTALVVGSNLNVLLTN